jgi:hypothetical protein
MRPAAGGSTEHAKNAKGEMFSNEIDIFEVGNVPSVEGSPGGNFT